MVHSIANSFTEQPGSHACQRPRSEEEERYIYLTKVSVTVTKTDILRGK